MSVILKTFKKTRTFAEARASRYTIGALCLVVAASQYVITGASAQSTELPAIVIEGGQVSTSGPQAGVQGGEFSGSVSTVTAQDIEKLTAHNVEDSLKYEPNLYVRKRFSGDNNAPLAVRAIHQFQTPRVLVYADGLLLSNFLGANFSTAPRWSVVAPHEIESVDVLYGPFSAQLPGNSMGATVSLNTKMPTGPEAFLDISTFHQSFDYYDTDDVFSGKKIYGSIGDKVGNTSYRISINHLQNESQPLSFRYLRDGGSGGTAVTGAIFDEAARDAGQRSGFAFGAQDFHDSQDTLVKTKVRHKFNQQWTADFTLAYWNSKTSRERFETYLRDSAGNEVFVGDVNINGQNFTIRNSDLSYRIQKKNDLLAGLTLHGENVAGFDFEGTVSLYNVLNDKTRRANGFNESLSNGAGRVDDAEGTGWETIDLKASRAVAGVLVTTGYHFDHYKSENSSHNTGSWRAADITSFRNANGGETASHGVFLEAKVQPVEKVEVTAGVRYDYWEAFDGFLRQGTDSDSYEDRNDDAFSPKFGISYKPTKSLTLDFAAAQATRFPTVGELFQGSLDSNGDFDPDSFDPNLKPEKSTDFNLSATKTLGETTLKATAFLSYVDDTIFRQQAVNPNTGNISNSFLNIPEMRNYGVELAFTNNKTIIPGLHIHANVSYTRAEITSNPGNVNGAGVPDTEGNQLPRVPFWRAAVTLAYEMTDDLTLSAGYRFSSDPFTDLENDLKGSTFGYTSGFSILDLKAEYEIKKGMKFSVAVDNVLDEDYFAFHPLPGRTFTAGFNAKF